MSEVIKKIAVIGAGTMGHGIAHLAALHGFETRLFDTATEAVERGLDRIKGNLQKGVDRGKVTSEAAAEALTRLTGSADFAEATAGVQLVIEAVPERLELKQQLALDSFAGAGSDVVFASNTSSLSLTAIASAAPRPEQVVGMHFFNPPHIMKLIEIVRAEQTSAQTLSRVVAVADALGREHIVVSDSAGFATSRLGLILGLEAMRMLEQGVASASEIDKAMELGYRHPMGPLKLTDLVGLDVRLAIAEHLFAEVGPQFRPPQILRRLVRAGKLGKKSGQGFYSWD
ncbi:MAG: 3-hydroxybutyryl-CoA dehydrogenase [Myxococcota bacterium]